MEFRPQTENFQHCIYTSLRFPHSMLTKNLWVNSRVSFWYWACSRWCSIYYWNPPWYAVFVEWLVILRPVFEQHTGQHCWTHQTSSVVASIQILNPTGKKRTFIISTQLYLITMCWLNSTINTMFSVSYQVLGVDIYKQTLAMAQGLHSIPIRLSLSNCILS